MEGIARCEICKWNGNGFCFYNYDAAVHGTPEEYIDENPDYAEFYDDCAVFKEINSDNS